MRVEEKKNKPGRPKTDKYANLVKDIQEYTKKTDYPILKELCYQKHYNYDTIMKYQREDEELMQSIKELLYKKETYLERNGILGKLSNTMAVFTLKQLGWKDNIEVKTNAIEDLTTLADMLGFKK